MLCMQNLMQVMILLGGVKVNFLFCFKFEINTTSIYNEYNVSVFTQARGDLPVRCFLQVMIPANFDV